MTLSLLSFSFSYIPSTLTTLFLYLLSYVIDSFINVCGADTFSLDIWYTTLFSINVPSPLTIPQRIASWSLAVIVSVAFYLGPLLLILPFILCITYPKIATCLFLLNVFQAFYPMVDWPQFQSLFQL